MGLVCRNSQCCPKHELFVSRTTTLSPQLRIVKTQQSCRHTSGSCKGGEWNGRRRYGNSTFRRAAVRLAEHGYVCRTPWLTRLPMPRLGLVWNITRRAAVCLYESISPVLHTALRIRRRCRRAICSCSHRDPRALSFVLELLGAFSAADFLKVRGAIALRSRFEMDGNGSLADNLR
jgi:hypothetical protein